MSAAVDHGSRSHAKWSASATARNWQCPGAIALSTVAPPQKSSVHASRGTAAHQIGEKALRRGDDPHGYLGTTEETNEGPVEIDEELVESASMYVEYVRGEMQRYRAETGEEPLFWIEESFSLAGLKPPFQAGGTGDFIIYFPRWKRIEVVDLKNGKGLVEVEDNKQLRTYGLGALLAHSDLDVDTIKVTIVQPRAPHRNGRIRSETFTVGELVAWTHQLLDAMRRSAEAEREYKAIAGQIAMDAWSEKWLNPGSCKFCPAEGFCPAIRRKAQKLADMWFEPDTGEAVIRNDPREMSGEALAEVLDYADMFESWLNAVRSLSHTLAERGAPPPGYVLVEKHGNRKWGAPDDKVAHDLKKVVGLTDADIYAEPKLKTPAQIEKALGSKRKQEIQNMWVKPTTGTNLVRADKTEREPVGSIADRYFEQPAA